jgi:lipopolysaccharide/colanic/teichoic acid biosynthesis glycosyltransferase
MEGINPLPGTRKLEVIHDSASLKRSEGTNADSVLTEPGRIVNLPFMLTESLIETDEAVFLPDSFKQLIFENPKQGVPVLLVSPQKLPFWEEMVKSLMDTLFSLLAIVVTLPLGIILAAGIKLTSKGPIFYTQERIGRFGKPFMICKFRSMHVNAEKDGPALSSIDDRRITKFGRFMRRARFDEIPNFINVLRGEMSLVGPRPERRHFINQIVERAPQYLHLLQVKPGITSWGQVIYGYAENVDQMIARSKYDLNYLKNRSVFADLRILLHTVSTIVKGKGV